ncbi:MAG: hypothetical protein LBR22_00295 [Desulfovibrio sp.]|jgi:hypothetical protein|nr:hypothetical protein [Desulfovibrio sp.]
MPTSAGSSLRSRWPEWAEAMRVDDGLVAEAYDATPAGCRAALKTGLALAFLHFGQQPKRVLEERTEPELGFWRHVADDPAPWAMVAFPCDYTAAARIAAACVPALLAGVPLVGAASIGGPPSTQALAALELSGVEDILQLDVAGLCALLEEAQPGNGRLVLLHAGELESCAHAARILNLPCHQERRPPILAIPDPAAFDLEALGFAHGAALTPALEPAHPVAPDAVFIAEAGAKTLCRASRHGPHDTARLALCPGTEGFWLHQGLGPAFFRTRRRAFGTFNPNPGPEERTP